MLLRETLKEIKDVSFLVDDDEVLDEALERLNVLKLLLKKIDSYRVKYSVGTAGSQCYEHKPKPKRPWDLTIRGKSKSSGKHGETTKRFKAARTI